MSARPRIVVDTNVVLDLLLFHDAASVGLCSWLDGGAVHWVACPAMRDELVHVLGRGSIRGLGTRWAESPAAVLLQWERHVAMVPSPPDCGLRCSDPDDQKFIDLAMAHAPCRLFTRDRALLKLRRRAAS